MELLKDKYTSQINTVEIGATKERGGTRAYSIKVGGETSMPFLYGEGDMPNKPVVAFEVLDLEPNEWPEGLVRAIGEEVKTPKTWAKKCQDELKAEALCVRLQSAHPEYGNKSPKDVAEFIKDFMKDITLPLIVRGCGDNEKDRDLMAEVGHALKGENCLLGIATQDNYKTLTASCLADGHSIISESPIDINIAKQVNIQITDMGFDAKRIVMHPTTGSLGYGMEYVYSIMERARLAAFTGDRTLSMPLILFPGQEAWRVKEAKEDEKVGIAWEISTSVAMLQAGADILVIRHPAAAAEVKRHIEELTKK